MYQRIEAQLSSIPTLLPCHHLITSSIFLPQLSFFPPFSFPTIMACHSAGTTHPPWNWPSSPLFSIFLTFLSSGIEDRKGAIQSPLSLLNAALLSLFFFLPCTTFPLFSFPTSILDAGGKQGRQQEGRMRWRTQTLSTRVMLSLLRVLLWWH